MDLKLSDLGDVKISKIKIARLLRTFFPIIVN